MGIYGDLRIGDKINNWTIISECIKNKYGKDSYLCECKYGNKGYVEGRALVKELSKSCGCLRLVDKNTQKERIKEYKKQYFQKNKEKISARNRERQKEQRKLDYKKYGKDRYSLKSRYGITINEYEEMIKKQNNKCFICGKELNIHINSDYPCVDHSHRTGKIRKILCKNCNTLLGLSDENLEVLRRAITYLEEFEYGN